MALIPFIQSNFTSMNRQKDPAQLMPGEYAILANGRVRNGGPQPINLPLDLSSTLPPFTRIQGLYGFDNFLLVFADGLCYYRNYDVSSTNFQVQPGFQLSNTAPTVWACAVPSSTINYNRIPANTGGMSPSVVASGGVQLITAINGSPSCIVCQDGVSQPFLILPDGTARQAQNFTQWSDSGVREYIPIGTLMLWINNKLYCLIKDTNGNYTMLASSVSGRPLDFITAIDVNGNKVGDEASGGAIATAYSVDYTEITCMSAVGGAPVPNAPLGSTFYVATQRQSYLIIPNYSATIYGEPTYGNQDLFSTGPKNNFSVCDILGDAAVIDDSGVKSFNSIAQTKVEGRNAPFSAKMNAFFGNADDNNTSIVQTITAAYSWSDYGFFAVNTIYGFGVLVYDQLLQSFVSFDQLFEGDVSLAITQFAEIKTLTGLRELFFALSDGRIMQYFGGSTIAQCGFYAGDFTPSGNGIELKPVVVNPVFTKVIQSGTVTLDVYLDSQKVSSQSKIIEADSTASTIVPYPQELPFGDNTSDQSRSPSFDLGTIPAGVKLGFYIQWNFSSMLLQVNAAGNANIMKSGFKQQARDYAQFVQNGGGAT